MADPEVTPRSLDNEDLVDRIDARAVWWRQHYFCDRNISCPSGIHPDARAMWWRQRFFEGQQCSSASTPDCSSPVGLL